MTIRLEEIDQQGAETQPREHRAPGSAAGLRIEQREVAGTLRPVAIPTGPVGRVGGAADGLLVVLDGTRVLRRVGRMVDDGELDPARLPIMVGIDPNPEDRGLYEYTPWWHPAYRRGAPDFGGGAAAFLEDVVLPVAREAQAAMAAEAPRGLAANGSSEADGTASGDAQAGGDRVTTPVGLLGYSLAGLFCLYAMMRTSAFATYLLASPSTWYPGFVNHLARTQLAGDPRVVLACGADEGLDHPEPIAGIRQDTDRLVAALSAKLSRRPVVIIDELDHHRGLPVRLRALLERWA